MKTAHMFSLKLIKNNLNQSERMEIEAKKLVHRNLHGMEGDLQLHSDDEG